MHIPITLSDMTNTFAPKFSKSPELEKFAELLIQKGMSVIYSSDMDEWFHFTDGNSFAYVEKSEKNNGYNFYIDVIPNKETGTAIKVLSSVPLEIDEAVITLNWFTISEKYSSLDQFITINSWQPLIVTNSEGSQKFAGGFFIRK